MATTALSLLTIPTVGAARDERIVSEVWNHLDQVIMDRRDIIIASDANVTLTGGTNREADTAWCLFRIADPSTLLTTTRSLTFPSGFHGNFIIHNTTAQTINVSVSGGSTITGVATGIASEFFSTGSEAFPLANSSLGSGAITESNEYTLKFSFMGQPDPLVECMRFTSVRTLTFPQNATNSAATADTTATASSAFTLYVNNTLAATITFPIGTAAATFSAASDVTVNAGDVVSLRAPAVTDATLTDMGFALTFLKTGSGVEYVDTGTPPAPPTSVTVVNFSVSKISDNVVSMTLQLSENAPAALQYRINGTSDPWATLSPAETSYNYGYTVPHAQSRTVPTGDELEFRATDTVGNSYTTSSVVIDFPDTPTNTWVTILDGDWTNPHPSTTHQYSADWTGQNGFISDGGATDAWRVNIGQNDNYGASTYIEFPNGTTEVIARFRQLLPTFNSTYWTESGYNIKMPGLTGDVSADNGGYGGSQSSIYPPEDRAWSARQQLHRPHSSYPDFAYGMELYHANGTNTGGAGNGSGGYQIVYGDTKWYSASGSISSSLALPLNQWAEIKVRVKMNSLGQSNGIIQTWLDGALGYENTSMEWSERSAMLIVKRFWFDVYYGGNAKPEPGELYHFFRQFQYQIIA